MKRCHVLLAVIGSGWLEQRDTDGKRRLDDPDDWVRREIATAFALGKRVIPILIGDYRPSVQDNLPQDIIGLVSMQSIRVNYRTFDSDVRFLLEKLIELEPDLGIGVVPGLVEVAKWWDGWSKRTEPALPTNLPLAGRDFEVNIFRDWVQGPASVLTLRSYSADDAMAFVAAVLAEHRPEFRAVLVSKEQGFSQCERLLGPLVVVLRCEEVNPRVLSGRGHHVVVLDAACRLDCSGVDGGHARGQRRTAGW